MPPSPALASDAFSTLLRALLVERSERQGRRITLEMVAEAYRRNDPHIWHTLKKFDQVLGLDFETQLGAAHSTKLPPEILQLRDEREKARVAGDFKRADELRREIDARGYEIRDSKDGPMLMVKHRVP